ncbi:hypothetical protein M406DRAFT_223559, partial [Cryphonectria parasitica EP155]
TKAAFHLHILPHQLYPAFGPAQDKHAWYRDTKYLGSEERTAAFVGAMEELGREEGIEFRFGGLVGDTLQAHRVVQYFQEVDADGDVGKGEAQQGQTRASRIVDALYRMYFEEEKDLSSHETLVAACIEAGIEEGEARRVVVEDEGEGLMELKALLRESALNGIDSVPHIMFEGRRRDLTLVGAKKVGEYVKAMETIAKEST